MSISYQGNKPGKRWYFWQNLKLAVVSNFKSEAGQKPAAMRKSAGLSLGTLVAGGAISYYLPLLPLIPFLASAAGVAGGVYFGYKSFQTFKEIKSGNFGRGYIAAQEQKWQARQAKGPFLKRLKTAVLTATNKAGRALGAVGAVAGLGLAAVGGLQLAGVSALSGVATAMAAVPLALGIGAVAALPVAIGICTAIVTAGILTVRKCNRNLNALAGIAPKKKEESYFLSESLRAKLDSVPVANTATPTFNATATPDTEPKAPASSGAQPLTEMQRRAAEERRRRR